MSEFNQLENKSTCLCIFMQDNSYEINFQKISEIETKILDIPLESMLEVINDNSNAINDSERIDPAFQFDISSNFSNQRKGKIDNGKLSKENLEEKSSNEKPPFPIGLLLKLPKKFNQEK